MLTGSNIMHNFKNCQKLSKTNISNWKQSIKKTKNQPLTAHSRKQKLLVYCINYLFMHKGKRPNKQHAFCP